MTRDWRDYPAAPMPGVSLGRVAGLAAGEAISFVNKDGHDLFAAFVLRYGDSWFAYVNDCPHAHTPLDWQPDQFMDVERRFIQCATHGALFEPDTGLCVHGPCRGKSLTEPIAMISSWELLMACTNFQKCLEFLAQYEKLGRGDIANRYKCDFCKNEARVACKRMEHFNATNEMPLNDLTPTGYSSMLIRLFGT